MTAIRFAFASLLAIWLGLSPACAFADALTVINAIRSRGCQGNASAAALNSNAQLNRAAQSLSRGAAAHDAARTAGYQMRKLDSVHLAGFDSDAELKQTLSVRYCAVLSDRELQDVGVAQRGGQIWILFGAQIKTPGEAAAVSRRVLELVNAARAKSRRCGNRSFDAAGPLKLNELLDKAALAHSQDMARYSYMEHRGHDGSTPDERVSHTGYRWRHTGENVAAGPGSADEVVAGWLNSPGHCANIMTAAFAEMGVAFAVNHKDEYGIYWTQVFGAPR